ncbi:hypothetical protein RIF29_22470 [Crotalaria pallida]|uniref:Uncharacterized protein n=1 Tax=Crotalaria pallida TaxID=3830 RepID=A0AAN9F735_CROPI
MKIITVHHEFIVSFEDLQGPKLLEKGFLTPIPFCGEQPPSVFDFLNTHPNSFVDTSNPRRYLGYWNLLPSFSSLHFSSFSLH